ncbi:MAG: M1 family aminopeptidase [Thermomicrobiales bacterium]
MAQWVMTQDGVQWRRLAGALVVLLALVGSPARAEQGTPTGSATPAASPVSGLLADVPDAALPAAEQALQELSEVRIAATLDPARSVITGDMAVTWRNPAAVPLVAVWFRTFPNAPYYGEGALTVRAVTVDGEAVAPQLSLDDTALRVPLPRAVPPGGSAEIAMQFAATIPADSTGSYGIFTHDTEAGLWVLADWHPLLAVYEDGAGWALPAVTPFGDPTYAPAAFYDVSLTAPESLLAVASGSTTETTTTGGQTTRRFIAGPARDFVMVVAEHIIPLRQDVDGTQVTLWIAPDLDPAIARRTLDLAADVLRNFEARWGPYPARELELIQVNPSGALGIAWTGLLFLDGPSLLEGYGAHNDDGLAAVVAHEISHLWWGVLVGGDSNKHGHVPEGLATVSALLYINDAFGPDTARAELQAWAIEPARRVLRAGDAIVDQPASDGQDEAIRYGTLYGKGTLGFLAVREAIGAAAFDAALREIAQQYAWQEPTPEQLRAAFEDASGQDLRGLWNHWFHEAAMTEDEIARLAASFDNP